MTQTFSPWELRGEYLLALPCQHCGETGHAKGLAMRNIEGEWTTRAFCHTSERPCYNERKGTYFEDTE